MNAPSAKRSVLVFLAGLVWSAVGILLLAMAAYWLLRLSEGIAIVIAVGIVGAVIIYWRGFGKLAEENLTRILTSFPGKDKICVFAFQNKRSYFIVPVMIVMGYTLRHLPVSKIYIAPVYIAIGLALFLASLKYYVKLIVGI